MEIKVMQENGKIMYEVLTDHLQIPQAYILDSEFDAREYCAMRPIHICINTSKPPAKFQDKP